MAHRNSWFTVPIKDGDFPVRYLSLPEGRLSTYTWLGGFKYFLFTKQGWSRFVSMCWKHQPDGVVRWSKTMRLSNLKIIILRFFFSNNTIRWCHDVIFQANTVLHGASRASKTPQEGLHVDFFLHLLGVVSYRISWNMISFSL